MSRCKVNLNYSKGDNLPDREYLSLISTLCNPIEAVERNVHFTSKVGLGRIGLGGAFLGFCFGIHFCLFLYSVLYVWNMEYIRWSVYAMLLSTFHFLEFLNTARWNPSTCTFDSYLLDHSFAYSVAAVASWSEFWIEHVLNLFNTPRYVFFVGLSMVVFGQFIRSTAMWQCGSNFSHIIVTGKNSDHKLVKTGLYSYLRHPAYFGWFWWSVGTQIMLGNPLCVVAYFIASWKFFNFRIAYEERILVEELFPGSGPDSYDAYCKTSYIGIPGIRGYLNRRKDKEK